MVGKSPANFIDLTGMKFGKLTVLERAENDRFGNVRWVCQCDCYGPNSIVTVRGYDLKSGKTKGCGCLNNGHPKHGYRHTKLYKTWSNMRSRCNNPNCEYYYMYGGQGITVCDDWNDDFIPFMEWALENGYEEGLTIDRIDNELGYNPDNCRWATAKQQSNNRRNVPIYSMNGEAHTLSEWCDIVGLPRNVVYTRIHCYNWTFEQAITTPIRTRN